MSQRTIDDLNINESNINNVAVVKDEQGNEFVCNLDYLVPASEVDESLRSKCVRNIRPENIEK